MAALAAFAASDKARLLVAAGVDVGKPLEDYDDVLAANLRAAVFVSTQTEGKPEPQIIPFADGHTEVKGLDPFGE